MELKIVTYNIKSGIYHPDGLEAVAKVLEAAEPDVISLQEVDRGTRRARQEDQTAWLARRLGMPYHCFGAATPWEGGGEYGLSLISAYPLLQPEVTQLWVPRGPGVSHGAQEPRVVLTATIAAPAGGLSSAARTASDDTPDEKPQNTADSGGAARGGGERLLSVMATHLGLTAEQRRRQAEQLVECAKGIEGRAVVLTGDFNGHPDSEEVQLLSAAMTDVMANVPEAQRITFPSGDPEMHGDDFLARTIDYIFVHGDAKVLDAAVIADYSLASDHNPCSVTLLIE